MTLRRTLPFYRNRLVVAPSLYDDAIYIFSPRKLRAAYTGPCARVKRSSDNAELDIDFVGGVLDESAISTFCGASTGFMYYYNQGTDSANYVTSFNQQIYNGSAIFKINALPALFFNANNAQWRPNVSNLSDYLMDKPSMVFATVYSISANSLRGIFGEGLGNNTAIGNWITTAAATRWATSYQPDATIRRIVNPIALSINTLYLSGYTKDDLGVVKSYINGSTVGTDLTGLSDVQLTVLGSSQLRWGGGPNLSSASNQLLGYSHEYISFNYYDAAKEAAVQSNQIAHYGI